MPLNILVVGAGVCGPAFATLMQRAKPRTRITIVERTPTLRLSGQQLDLEDQGVDIVKKMGLMDGIKSIRVDETGLEVLNSKAEPMAFFGVKLAGEKGAGLTSEYEMMRGDLVQLLYRESLEQNERLKKEQEDTGSLTYEFDKTITELKENDVGVHATFTDGSKATYDLVVGADGQSSRTRRLAFGQGVSDAAFRSLGINGAYFSVPRIEGEGGNAKIFNAPGSILISRTSGRPVTQFLLYTVNNMERLRSSHQLFLEEQREAFAEAFQDAGWQTHRILNGLRTAEDFYATELGQIKLKHLCTGRVALLGDAGYAPSPFTGLGVNGCLIGAWVLAGELARHRNDVPGALKEFDVNVRPGVEEIQSLPFNMSLLFPSSRIGLWVLRRAVWLVSKLNQLTWLTQFGGQGKKWELPEYPELNFE